MRWFEDFEVGEVSDAGPVTVTEAEIVDFARRYDPQPFHLDPDAARDGPFGGLVASGWHTAALFMGMFVRDVLAGTASLGSPGVEELRWLVPVRPGDTLRARSRIVDARASETRRGRGTLFTEHEVRNQRDEIVMTLRSRGLFARRPAPEERS